MCLLFLFVFHHADSEERSVPQHTFPIMYLCCWLIMAEKKGRNMLYKGK